jgi:hypothetical protein
MMDTTGLRGRALGEAVIEHVLTHPEQHDQSTEISECGTSGCIVGWVNVFAFGSEVGVQIGLNDLYSIEKAAAVLGVNHVALENAVYAEYNRDEAISNFKHLLDETYSESV